MPRYLIDCALELARSNVEAEDIVSMVCEVGEGTVHRLWEPLREKQAVPNGYAETRNVEVERDKAVEAIAGHRIDEPSLDAPKRAFGCPEDLAARPEQDLGAGLLV